jgi:hypothetical protein
VTPAPKFLLLFGTPRSGTTWLGKIFDSHPETLYKHEPDRRLALPFAPRLISAQDLAADIRAFFAQLPAVNTAHAAGRLPVFQKQYRSSVGQCVHKWSVLAAGAAGMLHRSTPILQCADVERPEVRVVWKSTDSLGRLGPILQVVEDCRAIRILRHPCGYIASVLRGEAQQQFLSSVKTSEDYGIIQDLLTSAGRFRRGLTLEHVRQLRPIERMAWIWVLLNEIAAEDTRNDRCIGVRYEDVCLAPYTNVRQLFSFCGLGWAQQTERFLYASTLTTKQRGLSPRESRYYGVFKDPVRSAFKWKSELQPEQIDRIYRVLRQSDLIRVYPESEPEYARVEAC